MLGNKKILASHGYEQDAKGDKPALILSVESNCEH